MISLIKIAAVAVTAVAGYALIKKVRGHEVPTEKVKKVITTVSGTAAIAETASKTIPLLNPIAQAIACVGLVYCTVEYFKLKKYEEDSRKEREAYAEESKRYAEESKRERERYAEESKRERERYAEESSKERERIREDAKTERSMMLLTRGIVSPEIGGAA